VGSIPITRSMFILNHKDVEMAITGSGAFISSKHHKLWPAGFRCLPPACTEKKIALMNVETFAKPLGNGH
jgi:hypothetical protein